MQFNLVGLNPWVYYVERTSIADLHPPLYSQNSTYDTACSSLQIVQASSTSLYEHNCHAISRSVPNTSASLCFFDMGILFLQRSLQKVLGAPACSGGNMTLVFRYSRKDHELRVKVLAEIHY